MRAKRKTNESVPTHLCGTYEGPSCGYEIKTIFAVEDWAVEGARPGIHSSTVISLRRIIDFFGDDELLAYDRNEETACPAHNRLPKKRPLRIGLLAGASSPEIVVGQVLERLADFLKSPA